MKKEGLSLTKSTLRNSWKQTNTPRNSLRLFYTVTMTVTVPKRIYQTILTIKLKERKKESAKAKYCNDRNKSKLSVLMLSLNCCNPPVKRYRLVDYIKYQNVALFRIQVTHYSINKLPNKMKGGKIILHTIGHWKHAGVVFLYSDKVYFVLTNLITRGKEGYQILFKVIIQ